MSNSSPPGTTPSQQRVHTSQMRTSNTPALPSKLRSQNLGPGSNTTETASASAPVSSSTRGGKFSWVRRLVNRRSNLPRTSGGNASVSAPVVTTMESRAGLNLTSLRESTSALQTSEPASPEFQQDTIRPTSPGILVNGAGTLTSSGRANLHFGGLDEDDSSSRTASTPTIHAQPDVGQNVTESATAIQFNDDHHHSLRSGSLDEENEDEDEDYDARSSFKRRSNSQFTVPSISRTSITTISPSLISADTASVHTGPLVGTLILAATTSGQHPHSALAAQHALDTASIVTLASSSKHRRRRSFDTNASIRAIAPESIKSRRGSLDSLPLTSTATIRSYAASSVSLRRWPGSASSVRSRGLSHRGSDEEEEEEEEEEGNDEEEEDEGHEQERREEGQRVDDQHYFGAEEGRSVNSN